MTNIRKLLGTVSFIAVLLLNQAITWAQDFGDDTNVEASGLPNGRCGIRYTTDLPGSDVRTAFVGTNDRPNNLCTRETPTSH